MSYQFPRASGVLLAISSLPSNFGVGDLGPDAYRFVDRLSEAQQSYWQVLPINYSASRDGCPYSCYSTFGYYPILISPERLSQWELVDKHEVDLLRLSDDADGNTWTHYEAVLQSKKVLFQKAVERFQKNQHHFLKRSYDRFLEAQGDWCFDLALFLTLTEKYGDSWTRWPEGARKRDPEFLKTFKNDFLPVFEYHLTLQFFFYKQWKDLRKYALKNNVALIGDLPIFVAHHSLDVWKNPEFFKLNSDGTMSFETGAPPDEFNSNGQKWSTPNYNWQAMADDQFSWWRRRIRHLFDHFDIVRIDHFVGMYNVFEIPVKDKTARNGKWSLSKGRKLLENLMKEFADLPIIAEDLGVLNEGVVKLRDDFCLPTMRVMQFAFGSGLCNDHLPNNIPQNAVVYTGTHDNNTLLGWATDLLKHKQLEEIDFILKTLNIENLKEIVWPMIAFAFSSKAHTAIVPLQDIMELGSDARFNIPGTTDRNWGWRFRWEDFIATSFRRLQTLTVDSQRLGGV